MTTQHLAGRNIGQVGKRNITSGGEQAADGNRVALPNDWCLSLLQLLWKTWPSSGRRCAQRPPSGSSAVAVEEAEGKSLLCVRGSYWVIGTG